MDIKNAFLHGDLKDKVYMEQPPGFVAKGESSSLICRLCRLLYGLKQSPRAWFVKFNTVLQQFGMTRSGADHSFIDMMQQIDVSIWLFTLMKLLSLVMMKMVSPN